jgi:hypothetical protein
MAFKRGTCCYSCGLPCRAYGEEIHGNTATGECEKGPRDLIRGSCWGLYRSERWLRNWWEREGVNWMGERAFRGWIVEKGGDGELINGVRLVISAWRERHGMREFR